MKPRKLDREDGRAFAAITGLDPAYVEAIDALPDDIAVMIIAAAKDLPGYSNTSQLAAALTKHVRKTGETTVRRRTAALPCKFVGRDRLIPSIPALLCFAQELADAPKIAGNVPPPRARGAGTADAGLPAASKAA